MVRSYGQYAFLFLEAVRQEDVEITKHCRSKGPSILRVALNIRFTA